MRANFLPSRLGLGLGLLVLLSTSSCGKKLDTDPGDTEGVADSISNSVESVLGTVSAGAGATESGANIGFLSTVKSSTSCTLTDARTDCTANVRTIDWNNCSIGSKVMSGGWTETFDSSATCSVANSTGLGAGQSMTRSSPSGSVATFSNGATLTSDTVAHTAYDGTTIPGTGILISNNSGGVRSLTVNGLHRVLKGPKGSKVFDHSITATMTMSGSRAFGNRTVSGTAKLYHNTSKYKAEQTFNAVTWDDSGCCYPTGGTISGTLTGTLTASTTLTFSSSCGKATFQVAGGVASQLFLSYCE